MSGVADVTLAVLEEECHHRHTDVPRRAPLSLGGERDVIYIVSTKGSPISDLVDLKGMIARTEALASRLTRTGRSFCLMLVRIPELELIHDKMEPTAYAAAVRHVVDLVVASMRATDQVGLVGAGMVMIALPETTGADALAASERVARILCTATMPVPSGRETTTRPEVTAVVVRHRATLDVQGVLDQLWQGGADARFGAPKLAVVGTGDAFRTAFQRRQNSRCLRDAADS